MKYTVRLIIAVLAASAALVSCTKDLAPGKSDTDSAAGTLRTVTVSFDTPTKSYLDGNQPRFSKGDSVLVSDGAALDTCAVDVDGRKTIIRTKLEGETLSAVYPYTAAVFDNYGNLVNTVKIPAIQTGKFADANICMAEQSSDKSSLRFRNRVAILKFYADESIGVDTIRVISESGEKIASGADTIVVTASKVEKSQLSNPTQDPRIWYVAMNTVRDASSLTFESVTSTQGTVTKKPKPVSGDNSIGIGSIYSVFIPYYIEVKVSDSPETYQKWAYCNVGAFLPEEPGLYFAWGDTTGYRWDAEKKQFEGEHSFSWENAPFNNDTTAFNSDYFATVKDEVCPNGVLALKYDAANANWGGKWRMPTHEESFALIDNGSGGTKPLTIGQGVFMITGTDFKIPASGYGDASDLINPTVGWMWTSSLMDDGKDNEGRCYFFADTISEDQPTTGTISAYSHGGTL